MVVLKYLALIWSMKNRICSEFYLLIILAVVLFSLEFGVHVWHLVLAGQDRDIIELCILEYMPILEMKIIHLL